MYLLEGNIGAGKTTLLQLIKHHISMLSIIQEPLVAWHTNTNGTTLLTEFYKDPKRWTFTMEASTLISRVNEYRMELAKKNPLQIMERSVYSGYHCFAKNGHEHAFMNDLEWHSYNALFNFLTESHCIPPTGFIYLQTNPQICHQRIQLRNRSGEETIPLSYLEQIHEKHEQYLINDRSCTGLIKNVPVLILNGDVDFKKDPSAILAIKEAIELFVFQTMNPRIEKHIHTKKQLHPII